MDERLERGRVGLRPRRTDRGAEGTPGRVVLSAVQIQSEHLTGFPAPIPQGFLASSGEISPLPLICHQGLEVH